ncbi:hypothetical protein HDF15_004674 [Granulicella mallensis]|uniref:Uncharacterized protein n=1 Tax=Granulicella mallensis TaxID=940614 RepID=A0A7W7ZV15_9BACT|nr:hypothetical protein [Granulicella mallensis]
MTISNVSFGFYSCVSPLSLVCHQIVSTLGIAGAALHEKLSRSYRNLLNYW